MTFAPGTKVIYRRYNKPKEPLDRVGVIKVCGRVWVDIIHEEGKLEYARINECFPADSPRQPNSPSIDMHQSAPTAAIQSKPQQTAAECGKFTALEPGTCLAYRYSDGPIRTAKGEFIKTIAGTYYGHFIAYRPERHTVLIRSIPGYLASAKQVEIKEDMVEPLLGEPRIDLQTGKKLPII